MGEFRLLAQRGVHNKLRREQAANCDCHHSGGVWTFSTIQMAKPSPPKPPSPDSSLGELGVVVGLQFGRLGKSAGTICAAKSLKTRNVRLTCLFPRWTIRKVGLRNAMEVQGLDDHPDGNKRQLKRLEQCLEACGETSSV
jgi:hypothetical protein